MPALRQFWTSDLAFQLNLTYADSRIYQEWTLLAAVFLAKT